MKKKLDKEFEKLEAVAEGSVEDAKDVFKEEEAESKRKRDKVLEYVDSQKTTVGYNQLLSKILWKRLSYLDLYGFTYKTGSTEKGVVMELYAPDGKIYRQAFEPVKGPKDVDAIDIFAIRCQSTIYGWVDKNTTSKEGNRTGRGKEGSSSKISH